MSECALQRPSLIALVAVFSVGLTGCKDNEDLAQIRALSQAVVSAEPSYTAIADDLYKSCLRETSWTNIGNFALRSTLPAKASSRTKETTRAISSDAAVKALAVARSIGGETTPGVDPFTSTSVCDPYIASTARWKATTSLLVGYFEALGAAAGDGGADYGYSDLWANVSKGGMFQSAPQAELSSATTDITTALFDARRRRLTAAEATKANAAVQLLIRRLSNVANEYLSQLDNEQSSVDSFFRRNFIAQDVGLQTLETIPYREDWKKELDNINAKRSAEAAYVSSLQTLAAGNDSIVRAAAEKNVGALYAATSATVTALKPDLASLQLSAR